MDVKMIEIICLSLMIGIDVSLAFNDTNSSLLSYDVDMNATHSGVSINVTTQSSTVSPYEVIRTMTTTTITKISAPTDTLKIRENQDEYSLQRGLITRIEEKLGSLGCDLPNLPNDFRIWEGNETHELILPITIPGECLRNSLESAENSSENCLQALTLSWDGVIEIQSGDVLIVRIDDTHLLHSEVLMNHTNKTNFVRESALSVYQVTRTGYDNCDETEGVLLDITPLKVDNKKIVTLYDKDLTLGMNQLIVVSKHWGNQCVRLKVIVKSDNCGENGDCSGKGICFSNVSMDGYECQCCVGYNGPHCEEEDACYPSPCKNNGICIGISQGHEGSTVQCLCPYGFTGKTCEERMNPCSPKPCRNGGTCTSNSTHYRCDCPPGHSGPSCERTMNECESSPCVHGICVDRDNEFQCYCQPGYTGIHCDYKLKECESSPCMNGGTCDDRLGRYRCNCTRGYRGKRCEIKLDLCNPNPCPEGRLCIDKGSSYSCECPKGYTDKDCQTPIHTACGRNPCVNGGTCFNNKDSFYCACKPGYTGMICEDKLLDETVRKLKSMNKDDFLIKMPISIHLNRLHNIYIAIGTLFTAFLIVAFIVTACHCRLNKTYKRFVVRTYPLWGCNELGGGTQNLTSENTEWFSGKDKAPTATPSRNLPSLDTADMYYTLDFSESQSSPLIQ